MFDPLLTISPLDGRYAEKLANLKNYFSEMALIRYRIAVEVEWFIYLCNELKLKNTRRLSSNEVNNLRSIYQGLSINDAKKIKNLEKTTNHDVKAVEYFLQEKMKKLKSPFLHFGCTSEDINNIAYAFMMRDFLQNEFIPLLETLIQELNKKAKAYKSIAMLSRTHGQPASPTTMGKECINFVNRLNRQCTQLKKIHITAKMNGATGNWNAHALAYPEVDWIETSKQFLEQCEFEANLSTTQIEPHDNLAEIFHILQRINTIILNFDRDMWSYISMGYYKQSVKKGEVGSSTMPHKVNPIDFENSEGNLGVANALIQHCAEKLTVSRLQRDLSDSTVMRNIGVIFGHIALAIQSTLKGLSKVEIDEEKLKSDLEDHWEVLTEGIQTILRKNGRENAYELMKNFSRGKKCRKEELQTFIKELKLPKTEEEKLLKLTPHTYTGLATKLVDLFSI